MFLTFKSVAVRSSTIIDCVFIESDVIPRDLTLSVTSTF